MFEDQWTIHEWRQRSPPCLTKDVEAGSHTQRFFSSVGSWWHASPPAIKVILGKKQKKREGDERKREQREGKSILVAQPGKVPGVPHKRPPGCKGNAPHNDFPRVTIYFSSQSAQTPIWLLLLVILLALIRAHVDRGRYCTLTDYWALYLHIIDVPLR